MRNSIKLLAFFASARLSFFPNSRPVIAERVTGCDFDFDFVFEAILFVDCCGGVVLIQSCVVVLWDGDGA